MSGSKAKTAANHSMRYSKKLRAPKSNGAWLIASSAPAKNPLQTNQAWSQHFSETHAELGELRRQAKSELLLAAQQYSAQFIDNDSLNLSSDRPFILSGHQPEFFHPGVWFKNFLLSRLARQMSAAPINLIIDNDECSDAHISMPAGTLASPHRETVEFDSLMEPLPFENRPRLDPTVLSQFVTTIQSNMAGPETECESAVIHPNSAAKSVCVSFNGHRCGAGPDDP